MKTHYLFLAGYSVFALLNLTACKPANENVEVSPGKPPPQYNQAKSTPREGNGIAKSPVFDSTSIRKYAASQENRLQAGRLVAEISASSLSWNEGAESATAKRLAELVELHAWLSTSSGYGNVVLAAECEWKSAEAIVSGVVQGKLPIADAQRLLDDLRVNRLSNQVVGQVVAMELPSSREAQKIAADLQNGSLPSLTKAGMMLLRDQGQDLLGMSKNTVEIIDTPNLPRAVQYYAMTTRALGWAAGIVDYLAAGGSIDQDEQALVADFSRRIPQFFVELSAVTGENERPQDLTYILKRWAK